MNSTTENQAESSVAAKPSTVRRVRLSMASKLTIASAFAIGILSGGPAAWADTTPPTSAADVATLGAGQLKTELLAVAGVTIVAAMTILAVKKGVKLLRNWF